MSNRSRPPRPSPPMVLVKLAGLLLVASLPGAVVSGGESREPLSEELVLPTLDGGEVDFGELRGTVVLIDFWGTWCKPCRQSTPYLRRLHERMRGAPFEIVSIAFDSDRQKVDEYIEEEGLDWPQVWDPQGKVREAFGVSTFPFFLIVDADGVPAATLDGWSDQHARTLDRAVGREVGRAKKRARRQG